MNPEKKAVFHRFVLGSAWFALALAQIVILAWSQVLLGILINLLGLAALWVWALDLSPPEFATPKIRPGLSPRARAPGPKRSRPLTRPSPDLAATWTLGLPRWLVLVAALVSLAAYETVFFGILDFSLPYWRGLATTMTLAFICLSLFFWGLEGQGAHLSLTLPRPRWKTVLLGFGGLAMVIPANLVYIQSRSWVMAVLNGAGLLLILSAFPRRLSWGPRVENPRSLGSLWPQSRPWVFPLIRAALGLSALIGIFLFHKTGLPLDTYRGLITYTALAAIVFLCLPKGPTPVLATLLPKILSRRLPSLVRSILGRTAEFGILAAILYLAWTGKKSFEAHQLQPGLQAFALAGILGLTIFPEGPDLETKRRWPRWLVGGLFVSLLVLAAVWRLMWLDVHTYGIENDEAGGVTWALDVLHGNINPILNQSGYLIMAWFQALAIHFQGVNRLTIRLPGAVFGWLTLIPAFYLFRYFLGRRVALWGVFLLAVGRWHLAYSRSGHWIILLPLFQTICFYYLLRAIKTRKSFCVLRRSSVAHLGHPSGGAACSLDAGGAPPLQALARPGLCQDPFPGPRRDVSGRMDLGHALRHPLVPRLHSFIQPQDQ